MVGAKLIRHNVFLPRLACVIVMRTICVTRGDVGKDVQWVGYVGHGSAGLRIVRSLDSYPIRC